MKAGKVVYVCATLFINLILKYYGIGNNEAVGYLSGDAAFLLAEDICEHGCVHCEKNTTSGIDNREINK